MGIPRHAVKNALKRIIGAVGSYSKHICILMCLFCEVKNISLSTHVRSKLPDR